MNYENLSLVIKGNPTHLNDVLLDTTLVSNIYAFIHMNIQKGHDTYDFNFM